jgi:hypothetical protein
MREYIRNPLGQFADIPGVGNDALPPARNAALTQRANTYATYKKADEVLTATGLPGKTLDFGAGLGMSRELGYDTYEPFPKDWTPNYNTAEAIPSNSYNKVTNLNVLNVVPPNTRDNIVQNIGRVLKPGGKAVITTRGTHEVLATTTAAPAKNGDPNAIITNPGKPNETYQKGFNNTELRDYTQRILGNNFIVQTKKIGSAKASVLITKLR